MAGIRCVNMRGYEVRRLLEVGSVRVVRPVTPQPQFIDDVGYWCWRKNRNVFIDEVHGDWPHDLVEHCPFGRVGDVVAVKEAFIAGWPADDNGYVQMDDGEQHVWYRASHSNNSWTSNRGATIQCWYDENGYPLDNIPWRSPATMQLWAVRTFATLVDVRAGQVQGVTEAEAVEAGISYPDFRHLPPDDLPDIAPTDIFADQHNAHTRNTAHKWERNPWCWIGNFELRGDE